jgi:tryptophan-rich sensory protein
MRGIASRSQLRMSFLRYALFTVPLLLLLGTVSARISGAGEGNAWFAALAKPGSMPPGWTFATAWTIACVLLGLVLALLLHARGARGRVVVVLLFLGQLILNYAWPPVFFAYHEIGAVFWLLIAMLLLSAAIAWLARPIRVAAAWLMLPYLAWLAFAALLTGQIAALNPAAAELAPEGVSHDIAG